MQVVRRCDGCGVCNAEAYPSRPHLCIVCGRAYEAYSSALKRHRVAPTDNTANLLNSYIQSYLIAAQAGYWIPPSIKKGPSVR